MEFALTHHHCSTLFNMLCNWTVTTHKSYMQIKLYLFLWSKKKKKTTQKTVNKPCCNQAVGTGPNHSWDVTTNIWLQEAQDNWGRTQAGILIQRRQIFLLLTCQTTYFDNDFYLHIQTLILQTQYSLTSTDSERDGLQQTFSRAWSEMASSPTPRCCWQVAEWGTEREIRHASKQQQSSSYMRNIPGITAAF